MTEVTQKSRNTRAIACKTLERVIVNKVPFSPEMIPHQGLSSSDAGFVAHLCFGALRYYPRLLAWLNILVQKGLKDKDTDVQLLLIIGLYQLFYSDTPAYAAINETVNATRLIKKPWAKGLVNGVLRNALRRSDELKSLSDLCAQTAHPRWLVKLFQQDWPKNWQDLCAANLVHAPLSLCVNASKNSRDEYLHLLKAHNIEATVIPYCEDGLMLSTPCSVDKIPGFFEGLVSVQDGAAQLAAHLLRAKDNERVLDACAAPGGKSAHILANAPKAVLMALEKDPKRCELLKETLARVKATATVVCADASQTALWWDELPFDKILLDAPCSATGIIRRHPDIKLLRQAKDISLLVQQQKTLLEKLWPLLKPNGILLYATCSVLAQENAKVIEQFLQTHPNAKELPIMEDWGVPQSVGRQILPGADDMDGFYYARLIKQ